MKTFENLISTLEKQLVPTGKVYLRFILMINQDNDPITIECIKEMFPKYESKFFKYKIF